MLCICRQPIDFFLLFFYIQDKGEGWIIETMGRCCYDKDSDSDKKGCIHTTRQYCENRIDDLQALLDIPLLSTEDQHQVEFN